jgi:hypothetical protein
VNPYLQAPDHGFRDRFQVFDQSGELLEIQTRSSGEASGFMMISIGVLYPVPVLPRIIKVFG